jgi:hypothetical protein
MGPKCRENEEMLRRIALQRASKSQAGNQIKRHGHCERVVRVFFLEHLEVTRRTENRRREEIEKRQQACCQHLAGAVESLTLPARWFGLYLILKHWQAKRTILRRGARADTGCCASELRKWLRGLRSGRIAKERVGTSSGNLISDVTHQPVSL